MIEILVMADMMVLQAQKELEANRKWWEEYNKQTPEMKKIMWDVRQKMEEEQKIERRHQEQIAAQREIALAIRYAARPCYY